MFSYFKNGIYDTTPESIIDLPGLVKIIKNNPHAILIREIRELRKKGDESYKLKKNTLPNITPNCMVRIRNFENDNFAINFIASSHFIYLDIDGIDDPFEYKRLFIEKYGHLVSMVCISSSCGGIAVLFKVTNEITSKDQFYQAWETIRTKILKDETIDILCKDIGRVLYVSDDPEVFVNYENEITLELGESNCIKKQNKKSVKQPISYGGVSNRLNEPFSIKSWDEIKAAVSLSTKVLVSNPVLELIPVKFAEVKFPHVIKDGQKHRVYTGMIHSLVYSNPNVEPDFLFSYLYYTNLHYADPLMSFDKLTRLFRFVYYQIIESMEYQYHKERIKNVHFNKKSGLNGEEKRDIASKVNGKLRQNQSIEKINQAKQYLQLNGMKITRKSVAGHAGVSLSTVRRHFDHQIIDVVEIVNTYNNSVPQDYSLTEVYS